MVLTAQEFDDLGLTCEEWDRLFLNCRKLEETNRQMILSLIDSSINAIKQVYSCFESLEIEKELPPVPPKKKIGLDGFISIVSVVVTIVFELMPYFQDSQTEQIVRQNEEIISNQKEIIALLKSGNDSSEALVDAINHLTDRIDLLNDNIYLLNDGINSLKRQTEKNMEIHDVISQLDPSDGKEDTTDIQE